MNTKIYLITGVLALTITGVALSQDQDRGMSAMDTDGNGTVEKSEFSAMLGKRFADTDKNNDGITLEEYQTKSDADSADRDARRDEHRAERDAKRDASRAEKSEKRAKKAEQRTARNAERLKNRFDGMDTDGDGKVTAEEYQAAGERMFDRMDRDGDGILNDRRRGRGDRGDRGPRNRDAKT